MDEFSNAREIAFKSLSQYETIKVIDKNHPEPKLKIFEEVWEIIKLFEGANGTGIELTLYLCFQKDFPLVIPRILLSKESYDRIKYIPHIDTDFFICTYDTEKIRTNADDPAGIVDDCLRRARIIIEQGLKKENLSDFKEEFLSYWECRYSEKDIVNENILSLIYEDPNVNQVALLVLSKKFGKYCYVLYQESEENKQFKNFLEEYKIGFDEIEVFYSEKILINDEPPFDLSNKQAIKLIAENDPDKYKEFEKKINKSRRRLFVLCQKRINEKTHYLGWFNSLPEILRPGFRPGSIVPLNALQTFQGSVKVERVSPAEYSNEKMNLRTAGVKPAKNFIFFVAGIGSIGSNLIHFLNSISFPEFRFVDYDDLTIDNIGRHLLGLNYVNTKKTLSVKEHLRFINPKQTISTRELSIIQVFEKEPDYINQCDYIFIAVGKYNIEKWVAERIKSGEITKPTFIFWIEPYLAGGHCLFIHPDDFKHDEFYQEIGSDLFFKYNVIAPEEYLNEPNILSLKEASCQATYTPYSGNNLVLFIGAIYPWILRIISGEVKSSKSASWIGDKSLLNSLNINLSDFGSSHESNSLVENTL